MCRKFIILFLSVCFCYNYIHAQENKTNDLQQRAEADFKKGNATSARYLYIRAYEDYVRNGQLEQGVQCGVKATALYYRENMYKEAFDLLRGIDQHIDTEKDAGRRAA